MNNNRNKKILVMMITSTLMTFPAWVNGQEPAATVTAAAADETGYEPSSGETIPDISSEKTPTIKKASAVTAPDTTKPVAEAPAADSGYTGYESAEELHAAAVSAPTTAPKTTTAVSAANADDNAPVNANDQTGYEPDTGTVSSGVEAKTGNVEGTAAAPAAETEMSADQNNGRKVGYLSSTSTAVIDTTTFPKYPIATLSQAEQAGLPYGDAVSDQDIAPYVGKTATAVTISPLPDPQLGTILQHSLAMRVGDAVNPDYIRHDVNVIGATGLFSTVSPAFTSVPEGVMLDYQVKINPVVAKIEITGNETYPTDQLLKLITTKPGMTLNTVMVSKDVSAINAQFGNNGYFLSHVTSVNMDDKGVLHIDIAEGRLQDIIVKGNTKTKTYVIMRELKIKKGQIFNKNLASRSIERIYNTGYFEDVNVRLLPGSNKNDVIMEIDVAEQKTGSITIGGGYSDSDGLVGILGLSETNLKGTGDKVSINWEFGGTTNSMRNYIFSYTRPWINDHGDSIGFSIFDRESDYDDYDQKGNSVAEYYKRTKGGNITYGRVRSEYVSDYVTLETKTTDYTNYVSGYNYNNYPGYLHKNFGRTNSLTWSHVFDNRDNVYDPTRGKRLSFAGSIAGHGLGGDFDFYKFTAESRTYYKVGHAQVIAVRLMGGVGFGDMPYDNLFSLGGADTLRGYEDDEFRGNHFYEGTIEYRFPMAKKVQGVLFTDAGNAWGGTDQMFWYEDNNKLHYSGGVGVRITTPIGPIRLDYGYGEEGGKFHFSFGGKF